MFRTEKADASGNQSLNSAKVWNDPDENGVVSTDGFMLGLITDEASQDIEEAAALAKKYGARALEIRTVFGKNPQDLDEQDIAAICETLKKNDMVCCGISSPFFKCDLNEANEALPSLETFIRLAKKLGTNRIRGFAFWKGEMSLQEALPAIKDALTRAGERLREEQMVLVLENEPTTYGTDAAALATILREVNMPEVRALWDPGNDGYADTGEVPYPNGYEIIKPYIHHVHIKDVAHDEQGNPVGVPFGKGIVDFAGQFERLAKDGYNGFCVLETHYRNNVLLSEEELKRPGGYAFSAGGMEASEECFENIIALFNERGYVVKN